MSNIVQASQQFVLRGTDQQVGSFLPLKAPTRRITPGSLAGPHKGLQINRFGLQNLSSTDDLLCGIGFRWPNYLWKAGLWDDSETGAQFTDDTTDAQDTGASDVIFINSSSEAAGDGFVVAAKRPFNWVSTNITQATTGNTTYAVDYSGTDTGAGATAWVAAAAAEAWASDWIIAASVIATGELVWAWPTPPDWAPVSAAAGSTFSPDLLGYYALRISIDAATVTQDALATAIEVGSLVAVSNVDANGTFGMEQCKYYDFDADAVVGFISSVASSEVLTMYAEVSHAG